MAPIRRYLRITKYSILEVRIYLDNPHLAESWLLNPRRPILPLVIESVRPLVLPKLREENERRKKGGKKKSVKDTVVEDDFEVSIFLTETSTRHSLLTKQKHFKDTNKVGLKSNSQKLTGDTQENAMEVEDADGPAILREESSSPAGFEDIPAAEDVEDALFVDEDEGLRKSKRTRTVSDSGDLTVDSDFDSDTEPAAKRAKGGGVDDDEGDDKKKMTMDTTYDGFSIYGRVLCLVVKKKDRKGKGQGPNGGQAMMEDWITSTQIPPPEDDIS